MKVKLLKYTEDPERVVAMAARLCYSAVGAEELSEKMSDAQVKSLVEKIVGLGHASTMEHVSFTFAMEGIIASACTSSHRVVFPAVSALCQRT